MDTPTIRTDQQAYTLRYASGVAEIHIAATFENRGNHVVLVEKCGRAMPAFYLEKRVGDSWKSVYEPVCSRVVPMTVEVPSGGTYTDSVVVVSRRQTNSYPRFEVEPIAGTYRLVYRLHWSRGVAGQLQPGGLVPLHLRVSNSFELTEES